MKWPERKTKKRVELAKKKKEKVEWRKPTFPVYTVEDGPVNFL